MSAKRILPKQFRDDPFADPPPITENDIADGMYSLLNRGIIPRDVDLSPAFERNSAPFAFNRAALHFKSPARPPQLSKKVSSPKSSIKDLKLQQLMPQNNVDTTFLTQLGGQRDITEHLNRITSTGKDQPYSSMTNDKKDSRPVEMRINSRVVSRELQNRIETASDKGKNDYALVPVRNDDENILTKTFQSFKLQQDGMSQ